MTRRALEAALWISARLGKVGHDEGKGEMTWIIGTGSDDPDEPMDYIELRYEGMAPEVDIMVFSDLAYAVIGFCVSNGIKYRTSGQIVAEWERQDAEKGKPPSALRH